MKIPLNLLAPDSSSSSSRCDTHFTIPFLKFYKKADSAEEEGAEEYTVKCYLLREDSSGRKGVLFQYVLKGLLEALRKSNPETTTDPPSMILQGVDGKLHSIFFVSVNIEKRRLRHVTNCKLTTLCPV
jgi:hypothetical protein